MAYICKLDAHNGRLNLEKCVDLDIPLALIHKLKNFNKNETIPLPDGRLITWKDIHDYVDDEKNFIGNFVHGTPITRQQLVMFSCVSVFRFSTSRRCPFARVFAQFGTERSIQRITEF